MYSNELKKVSVIVPIYNVEKYLDKCLYSLSKQTIDSYEVLLINDGSTDSSQEIIDIYTDKYPNIFRKFKKINGGLSSARNYGIGYAFGEYLSFVDSDDLVDSRMLEEMYNEAKRLDAEVVYCAYTTINDETTTERYCEQKLEDGSSVRDCPALLKDALSYAWNKLYKKAFWDYNKFEFKDMWFEDVELIYNVLLKANIVSCVNKPLYFYRKNNPDSITNILNRKTFDIFKAVNSIVNFYKSELNENYIDYKENVENICLIHLYARINLLNGSNERELVKKYIDEMFLFLNVNFPNYKNSEWFKCDEKAKITTKIIHMYIYKNKILLYYLLSPKMLKLKKQIKNILKM